MQIVYLFIHSRKLKNYMFCVVLQSVTDNIKFPPEGQERRNRKEKKNKEKLNSLFTFKKKIKKTEECRRGYTGKMLILLVCLY